MRISYTMHRYHVYNDLYHWPRILSTTDKYGEITHSDYAENMSQLNKLEAQSCHFNKQAYSLHCTVEHINPITNSGKKSPYRYIYHLSDEMKHDFAFTSLVADHCLQLNALPTLIRRKSDNCGSQYKCRWFSGNIRSWHKNMKRR